jgi:hypothetical protein
MVQQDHVDFNVEGTVPSAFSQPDVGREGSSDDESALGKNPSGVSELPQRPLAQVADGRL